MMYTLHELLTKMGAPEAKEKGHLSWHYFDPAADEITGFAEIRLTDEGLIAELKHVRHNYKDDEGHTHASYVESFYLYAEKTGARYKVTKVAFDGEEYAHPQKAIIELGLSIFHARALDISILMVEQAFNKQDILRPAEPHDLPVKNLPLHVRSAFKKETWGIVVPFRPRAEAGAYR